MFIYIYIYLSICIFMHMYIYIYTWLRSSIKTVPPLVASTTALAGSRSRDCSCCEKKQKNRGGRAP